MSEQILIEPELWDLIPDYLERRHCDVDTLREALERRDYGALHEIGHKLRGSGASYGFAEISRIGRALEQAAEAQQDDRIRSLVTALAAHLDVVEPVRERD